MQEGSNLRFLTLSAIVLVALGCCAQARAQSKPAPFEDSVYVYDVFKGNPDCAELGKRVTALALRPTLILSIEQGPEFVLDRPNGEEQLGCAINAARSSGHAVKLMLLQDPVFLERGAEAVRRATLVSGFGERHPAQVAGVQVDVEPYTIERWGCCGGEERRAIMRDLSTLLARVRRELKGIPLGVVAPWWYPATVKELPEAGPEQLFQVVDEIYLMAYGDEGGPLVGGSAERILQRIDAPEFFTGQGRLYVALASYEYAAPAALDATIAAVRARLALRPTFAGTTVFHAAGPFNVPLQRLLSGSLVDTEGKPIQGAEIEAGGQKSKSSGCGGFGLGRLPGEHVELVIRKAGYRTRTMSVQLNPPGSIKELPKLVLEKEPQPEPGPAQQSQAR